MELTKLQYISQGATNKEQHHNILAALDGGCNWIQLRHKNGQPNEINTLAEEMKLLCEKYKATFIINDSIKLAKEIDADGVHLGLKDESVTYAREILGNQKIIGGTANSLNDVMNRISEGCNYIGLGPFRFTSTKEKLSPILGYDGIAKIAIECKKMEQNIPIYAIGGITVEDIELLMSSGIYGIALSGEITRSEEKKKLINEINIKLYETSIDYSSVPSNK